MMCSPAWHDFRLSRRNALDAFKDSIRAASRGRRPEDHDRTPFDGEFQGKPKRGWKIPLLSIAERLKKWRT